jgi:hypothetical protein
VVQVIQDYIHQELVPEPLQKVKQEPLLAIEEAEAEDIAIEEIEAGPNIQRQAIPDALEPEGALVGCSKQGRPDVPCYAIALS